jgi:hypothetical protein
MVLVEALTSGLHIGECVHIAARPDRGMSGWPSGTARPQARGRQPEVRYDPTLGGQPTDTVRQSSIASLYIVKNSDLPAIVNAAGPARAREAIHQLGEELDEQYGWSGNVMLSVLKSLDTLNILLESRAFAFPSAAARHPY